MDTLSFLRSCEPADIIVEIETRTVADNTVCIFTKDDDNTVLLNEVVQYDVVYKCITHCNRNDITLVVCNFAC